MAQATITKIDGSTETRTYSALTRAAKKVYGAELDRDATIFTYEFRATCPSEVQEWGHASAA